MHEVVIGVVVFFEFEKEHGVVRVSIQPDGSVERKFVFDVIESLGGSRTDLLGDGVNLILFLDQSFVIFLNLFNQTLGGDGVLPFSEVDGGNAINVLSVVVTDKRRKLSAVRSRFTSAGLVAQGSNPLKDSFLVAGSLERGGLSGGSRLKSLALGDILS